MLVDLRSATFEEFIEAVFAVNKEDTDREARLEFATDPVRQISYLRKAFLTSNELPEQFSNAQIERGLWLMLLAAPPFEDIDFERPDRLPRR